MKAITDKHEIEKVQAELLPRLINDWALITVGTPEDWNTMTIAWGSMGDMWWQPVVNCWVTPARYTYEFLERHGSFTVSFFPAEYHDDLMTLGTKSGRDGDKVALTKLTPKMLEGAVTFEEADTTLVCEKIYAQPLDPAAIPEEFMEQYYRDMPPHAHFMGKIAQVLK